jgi:hypothetical protein
MHEEIIEQNRRRKKQIQDMKEMKPERPKIKMPIKIKVI